MNYYEIYRDGLKLTINTDIMHLDKKMDKYFSGCFNMCTYNKNTVSNETVNLDILQRECFEKFYENCFVMLPNTYIYCKDKNRLMFTYDKFNEIQRLNLKRIVIDIFAKYYESLGTYFIHAAGVVNRENNKATVFIGDTGSGKTTNLLFYLLSGQYDYIGNDRIGLRYSNGDLIVSGFPSNLGIRYSTLELNSTLKDTILSSIEKEQRAKIINNSMKSEKFNFNIFDLLNTFGCRLIPESKLSEFIVTCCDDSIYKCIFDKMTCTELQELIEIQHIPSVSKEQHFLNGLLDFKCIQTEFNLCDLNISAYKSNLHPNCNKRLMKKI